MMRALKPIPLEAYFADCCLPHCPSAGTVHQHVLPHQRRILDSRADYLYCQGGVGSAKSEAFAAKVVRLALGVEKNIGVVCRKDYKLLYKSSWLAVKQVLARLHDRGYIPMPSYSDKRQGDYTTITLENGSIIYAMQGKAWQEGLGPSYGFFWVDDAMESLEEMFVGTDVSAGLLSRLRLPHVRYHREGETVVNRLQGLVSSNPPPVGHWLHKLFGKEPGEYCLGVHTVEWLQTATVDNPFLGPEYAKGLIAAQARMGHHLDVARRVIYGESIPAYGGQAVFPQFSHARHVGIYKYDAALPLILAWDFGLHHPAVVCSQLLRCQYGTQHYFSISEVADAFSVTVHSLWEDHVRPHMRERGYDKSTLVLHAGDRAGWRNVSTSRDRRGDMKILKEAYNLSPFRWKELNLNNSLQYMRALLDPKKPCRCGRELVGMDQLGCPVLIGALEGGYKYQKTRQGQVSEKPFEDRYFADVACAWRYGAENYVRFGVPWEVREGTPAPLDEPRRFSGFGRRELPWEWMSDREMAQVVRQ